MNMSINNIRRQLSRIHTKGKARFEKIRDRLSNSSCMRAIACNARDPLRVHPKNTRPPLDKEPYLKYTTEKLKQRWPKKDIMSIMQDIKVKPEEINEKMEILDNEYEETEKTMNSTYKNEAILKNKRK